MDDNKDTKKIFKIPYINLVPIAIIIIFIYKLVDRIDYVTSFIALFTKILTPVIIGMVLAYLIHPIINWIEKNTKLKRGWSILVIYLALMGIISILIAFILPALISSISDIVKHFPQYIVQTNQYFTKLIIKIAKISGADIDKLMQSKTFAHIVSEFGAMTNNLLSNALSALASFSSGFFNFIMGLIISIYVLKEKEGFAKGSKRLTYAILDKKKGDSFIAFMKDSDNIFSRYISGKLLDSSIIAILAFIGLYFIGAPYTLLLAIIIGITNMIPYFGPFIGGIPAIIITLFYSPISAFWVAVFIFILQQFDGNILGPKILGNSVGVGPFWIILAIIIGGGLFGILGMLIGVPVIAIILNLINKYIDNSLKNKGLS